MEVRRRTKIKAALKFKIEEVLAEVLKKEMFIASGKKFRYIDDWDTVMNSIYELPVEYDGYTKRVSEMNSLKEIINTFERNDFNEVKRSESRRKQMQQFK